MEGWGQLLRDKFDTLLLFTAWLVATGYVLHLMHHGVDRENIAWAREATSSLLGAFLGLTTGIRMSKSEKE